MCAKGRRKEVIKVCVCVCVLVNFKKKRLKFKNHNSVKFCFSDAPDVSDRVKF